MKNLLSMTIIFAVSSIANAKTSYSPEDYSCHSVTPNNIQALLAEATYAEKTATYYYYQGQVVALKSLLNSQAEFGEASTSNSKAVNYVINLLTEQQEKDVLLLSQRLKKCEQSVREVAAIVSSAVIPACVDKSARGIQDQLILSWDCSQKSREEFKNTVGTFHIQRANLIDHFIRGRMSETYMIGRHIRTDGRTADLNQLSEEPSTQTLLIPWTSSMNLAYPIFARVEADYLACNESSQGAVFSHELHGSHCKEE